MPPNDPSYPMLKIVEDLGAIKEGVSTLKPKVDEIHSSMVTKEDCKDHRDALCKKVDAKLKVVSPQEIDEPEKAGLLERVGKKAGAIAAILTLVGLVGTALLVLSRMVARVDHVLAAQQVEDKQSRARFLKEIRRAPEPVIVHQPILVYPDAGLRRARRPHRRPARRRVP